MGKVYTNRKRKEIPPGEILKVLNGSASNVGDTILYMNSEIVPYITLEALGGSKYGNRWGNDPRSTYIFESIGNIFD